MERPPTAGPTQGRGRQGVTVQISFAPPRNISSALGPGAPGLRVQLRSRHEDFEGAVPDRRAIQDRP